MINWRKQIWLKIVALTICGVFLFSDVTWAARFDYRFSIPEDKTVSSLPNTQNVNDDTDFMSQIFQDMLSFLSPRAFAQEVTSYSSKITNKNQEAYSRALWKKIINDDTVSGNDPTQAAMTAQMVAVSHSGSDTVGIASGSQQSSESGISNPAFVSSITANLLKSGSDTVRDTVLNSDNSVKDSGKGMFVGVNTQSSSNNNGQISSNVGLSGTSVSNPKLASSNSVGTAQGLSLDSKLAETISGGTNNEMSVRLTQNGTGNFEAAATVQLKSNSETVELKLALQGDKLTLTTGKNGDYKVSTVQLGDNSTATYQLSVNGKPATVDFKVDVKAGSIQIKSAGTAVSSAPAVENTVSIKPQITTNTGNSAETANIEIKAAVSSSSAKPTVETAQKPEVQNSQIKSTVQSNGVADVVTQKTIQQAGFNTNVNSNANLNTLESYTENNEDLNMGTQVRYVPTSVSYFGPKYMMPELGGVIPGGYRHTATSSSSAVNSGIQFSGNNNNQDAYALGSKTINNVDANKSVSYIDSSEIVKPGSWKGVPRTGPPKTEAQTTSSVCISCKQQTVSSSAATVSQNTQSLTQDLTGLLSISNQTPNRAQNPYSTQLTNGPGSNYVNCATYALASLKGISLNEASSILSQYSNSTRYNPETKQTETSMFALQQATGLTAKAITGADLKNLEGDAVIYFNGHYVTYNAAKNTISDNGKESSLEDYMAAYKITDASELKVLVGESDKNLGKALSDDDLQNTYGAAGISVGAGASSSAAATASSLVGSVTSNFSSGSSSSGSSKGSSSSASSSGSSSKGSSSSVSSGSSSKGSSSVSSGSSSSGSTGSTGSVASSRSTSSSTGSTAVNLSTKSASVTPVNLSTLGTSRSAVSTTGTGVSTTSLSNNRIGGVLGGTPTWGSRVAAPLSTFSMPSLNSNRVTAPAVSITPSGVANIGMAFNRGGMGTLQLSSLTSPAIRDTSLLGASVNLQSYKNYGSMVSVPTSTTDKSMGSFSSYAKNSPQVFNGVAPETVVKSSNSAMGRVQGYFQNTLSLSSSAPEVKVLTLGEGEKDFGVSYDQASKSLVMTDKYLGYQTQTASQSDNQQSALEQGLLPGYTHDGYIAAESQNGNNAIEHAAARQVTSDALVQFAKEDGKSEDAYVVSHMDYLVSSKEYSEASSFGQGSRDVIQKSNTNPDAVYNLGGRLVIANAWLDQIDRENSGKEDTDSRYGMDAEKVEQSVRAGEMDLTIYSELGMWSQSTSRDAAEQCFDRALAIAPTNPTLIMQAGDNLVKSEKYDAALRLTDRINVDEVTNGQIKMGLYDVIIGANQALGKTAEANQYIAKANEALQNTNFVNDEFKAQFLAEHPAYADQVKDAYTFWHAYTQVYGTGGIVFAQGQEIILESNSKNAALLGTVDANGFNADHLTVGEEIHNDASDKSTLSELTVGNGNTFYLVEMSKGGEISVSDSTGNVYSGKVSIGPNGKVVLEGSNNNKFLGEVNIDENGIMQIKDSENNVTAGTVNVGPNGLYLVANSDNNAIKNGVTVANGATFSLVNSDGNVFTGEVKIDANGQLILTDSQGNTFEGTVTVGQDGKFSLTRSNNNDFKGNVEIQPTGEITIVDSDNNKFLGPVLVHEGAKIAMVNSDDNQFNALTLEKGALMTMDNSNRNVFNGDTLIKGTLDMRSSSDNKFLNDVTIEGTMALSNSNENQFNGPVQVSSGAQFAMVGSDKNVFEKGVTLAPNANLYMESSDNNTFKGDVNLSENGELVVRASNGNTFQGNVVVGTDGKMAVINSNNNVFQGNVTVNDRGELIIRDSSSNTFAGTITVQADGKMALINSNNNTFQNIEVSERGELFIKDSSNNTFSGNIAVGADGKMYLTNVQNSNFKGDVTLQSNGILLIKDAQGVTFEKSIVVGQNGFMAIDTVKDVTISGDVQVGDNGRVIIQQANQVNIAGPVTVNPEATFAVVNSERVNFNGGVTVGDKASAIVSSSNDAVFNGQTTVNNEAKLAVINSNNAKINNVTVPEKTSALIINTVNAKLDNTIPQEGIVLNKGVTLPAGQQ
ncbi:MAG: hypothetical protein PHE58_03395, partial [Candidatus Omnitrophica bacterium]|nr:hypothetical protein [Candidatus Omnitrophota bacterium]